jgi:hypothetical protein
VTKPRPAQRTLPHSSSGGDVLQFTLRFTRARDAADPYEFHFGSQQYICQREDGRVKVATLDWNDELLVELEEAAAPGASPAVVQRLGNRLRKFLETTDWPRYEERIVRAVTPAGPSQDVHITIVSNAAELYALPWELLTLEATGQHLGELPNVMFRYAWPGTTTIPEKPSPRPGRRRVLLAWSESNGAVPHEEHRTAIRHACERAEIAFRPDRDEIPRVSYERLGHALAEADRAGSTAILHVLCHGITLHDTVALGFHGEHGRADLVDATRLRRLLAPHAHHIRLVVLMACHGGDPGALGNHLGSIAQNLHRVGIQAVIASRFPLSLRASTCFAGAFYEALLAAHAGMEKAFQVSRTTALRGTSGRDWSSFQLYARPEDSAVRQEAARSRQGFGPRLAMIAGGMAGVLIAAFLVQWCSRRQEFSPRGDEISGPRHLTPPIQTPLSDAGTADEVLDARLREPDPPVRADTGPPSSSRKAGASPPRRSPDAGTAKSLPPASPANLATPHEAVETVARQSGKSYQELRSDIHVASIAKNYELVLQLCEDIQRFPADAWVHETCGEAACETRTHTKARFYYARLNKRSQLRIARLCERKDIHLDG